VRQWAILRQMTILPSFDGGSAVVVDEDGIALLDVLADKPRVLWRELDRDHRVVRIGRTPGQLTALIDTPPAVGQTQRMTQLWTWQLPDMTLRVRRNIDMGDNVSDAAVCDGSLVLLTASDGDPKLHHFRDYREPVVTAAAQDTVIRASGAAFTVQRPLNDQMMCTVDVGDQPGIVYATFPDTTQPIGVREHAGIVTLWDPTGRIVAAEPGAAGDLASLTTAL
jgi:hypothetical protein